MKRLMVFPRYFKWIGLVLFICGFIVFPDVTDMDDVAHLDGLVVQIMSFIGLFFIAGARVKDEDEWIQHVRLTSIQWAIILYMLIRISFKVAAFYLKDPAWLPDNFQINSLLLLFILIFYTRVKLIPFLRDKFASNHPKHP